MRFVPQPIETLWTLFTAPVVWAAHFLFCYISAAVYCAKQPAWLDFGAVRIGIVLATLISLALIVFAALLAWRQWGFGTDDPPHDDATRSDRLLFQGYATLLLSGLSFVAVVFTAMPALLIATCAP
jgi:Kef-type K+ transport system membrane component KefB